MLFELNINLNEVREEMRVHSTKAEQMNLI